MPRTRPLILAPPEKLLLLAQLRERRRQQESDRLRRLDVFPLIGYEPNCLPRYAVRERFADRMGIANAFDPRVTVAAAAELPPLCGGCPQELFHAATEDAVLYGGASGGGKMLSVFESIPTPRGWTTMGELRPGDEVFTETGAVCRVTAVHPVDPLPAAYRLTFDDGTAMDACADHEWLTYDQRELAALSRRTPEYRAARRRRRPSRATGHRSGLFTAAISARNRREPPRPLAAPVGTVRTTKQIAGSLLTKRGGANHAVPVAGALELPGASLPLDPYVLGAWLGDGTAGGSGFTTADPQILGHFEGAGWTVTDVRAPSRKYAYRIGDVVTGRRANGRRGQVNTFTAVLRELGVLQDKHIPQSYLRASQEQRLALLQGLMDTDGTVSQSGSASFTTTNPQLADGFFELVVSLGWKVRQVERRARLNGKDCGPAWQFKWTPDRIVFRLDRKASRQVLATRRTTRFRYIVGCEEIPGTPMRCITVDNPAHLYLAGRSMLPTHNSHAITAEGIRACVRHAGLRVLLVRRTYDELEESIFPALRKFGMAEAVGGKWNGSTREIKFTNGSIFRFRYLETKDDASRRQGGEYQLLLVDELTLMAPGVVDILRYERLRAADGLPVIGLRATTNPGGASHGQVKEEFIEATDHGGEVAADEHGLTVRFIQAKATDNPHLDAGHRARLDAIPDPARRAAMRDGDWDQFSGMIFKQYRWDRHTIDPVPVPPEWARYNGVDWGFAAPWAVMWTAFDEDGRAWIYREIYETQVGEAEQARRILAAEADGEEVAVRYADDAMWAVRGDAKPIAQVYAENGCHLTPAGKGPGSRVAGWQRWHSYLAEGPACRMHRTLGWVTCPMVHIFRTCEKTIFELKNLPYARKGNVEDADTAAADHLMDAGRYLFLNVGGGPQYLVDEPEKPNPFAEVEVLQAMGNWAVRPDPLAPDWDTGDAPEPVSRIVRENPFT